MQVPFRMPATALMRLPARPSRSALMTGMPPATAASKASATPRSSAAAASAAPCTASSALLAVTTGLPAAMRRLDQRARRPVGAADQLHHDIDRRVGGQRHRVVVPAQAGYGHAAVLRAVARRNRGDRDRPPGARGDDVGVVAQQLQHAAADRAQAGEGDGERPGHGAAASDSIGSATLRAGLQERADVADRLAQPVGVLHQGDAHKALAVLAEAQAGGDRDLGAGQQQLAELDAAELGEARRDRRPGEHRAVGAGHVPAGGGQAADQHVAALAVQLAHLARRSPAGRSARRPRRPGSG